MRLLTLNIRFGAGIENPETPGYDIPFSIRRLRAIAAAIGAMTPDVVALQEVYGAKQAEIIADRLNMSYVYTPHPRSYPLDFFEWGLAFLFRFKLIRSANHPISVDRDIGQGRHGLRVRLAVGEFPVDFVNVHFDRNKIEPQVGNLLRFAGRSDVPPVLMGDFNCRSDDTALEPIIARWSDTCRAVESPGSREAEETGTLISNQVRIDHIFVASELFSVEAAGLLPAGFRHISDHIGYYTDLRIRRRKYRF